MAQMGNKMDMTWKLGIYRDLKPEALNPKVCGSGFRGVGGR